MIYLVVGIGVLVLVVAAATYLSARRKGEIAEEEPVKAVDGECCGAHAVCEKGLKRASEKVDYFDDEELDAYRGTAGDAYTDEGIDAFREVLYTLRPEEVEDWLISLEKRGLALPNVLRQELV